MAVTREFPTTLEGQEDAIVAALAADASISSYARLVATWQGTLDDAIEQEAHRNPAILVLYAGAQGSRRGGHDCLDNEWHVLVRDRNLRRESLRRAGAEAGEPGTYRMVQDVLRVLAQDSFELPGGGPMFFRAIELLQTGRDPSKTTSAYLVVFTSELDLMALEAEQALEDIDTTLTIPNLDEDDGSTTWVDLPGDLVALDTES